MYISREKYLTRLPATIRDRNGFHQLPNKRFFLLQEVSVRQMQHSGFAD